MSKVVHVEVQVVDRGQSKQTVESETGTPGRNECKVQMSRLNSFQDERPSKMKQISKFKTEWFSNLNLKSVQCKCRKLFLTIESKM